MPEEHNRFMRIAIRLSKKNVEKCLGGPFGAVIVKDNTIIARSTNIVTTTYDPTAHAEIAAIRLACKKLKNYDLTGCVIYTSCEPCPMCLGAIYWAGIDIIYYANTKNDAADIGFNDQFIYDEIALDKPERKLPAIQLLRNEAIQVFKEWEISEQKTKY